MAPADVHRACFAQRIRRDNEYRPSGASVRAFRRRHRARLRSRSRKGCCRCRNGRAHFRLRRPLLGARRTGDGEPSLYDATFLNHDRAGIDITSDYGRWLQLDACGCRDVTLYGAADNDLTRRDVTDDGGAIADDDDVGTTNRSIEATVDTKRALGLDISTYRQLRVEHGIS